LTRQSRIEVPRVDYKKLSGDRLGETSAAIRRRVQTVLDRQRARFSQLAARHPIFCNAVMRVGEIRQFCKLQDEGGVLSSSKPQRLMRAAMSQLNLSARGYHCILKLARTVADLAGCAEIQSAHLAEALQYRPKLMIG
jgi:magnesium chelatase family protein